MLECWTNGKVKATPHRVVRPNEERMSLIRFNGLDNDTLVLAHSKFIPPENPLQDRYADGLVQGHGKSAQKGEAEEVALLRPGRLDQNAVSDEDV